VEGGPEDGAGAAGVGVWGLGLLVSGEGERGWSAEGLVGRGAGRRPPVHPIVSLLSLSAAAPDGRSRSRQAVQGRGSADRGKGWDPAAADRRVAHIAIV